MKTDLGDVSPRDEKASASVPRNKADNRRIFVLAITDDNVADNSDLVTTGVEYRTIQDLRQIEHRLKIAEFGQ